MKFSAYQKMPEMCKSGLTAFSICAQRCSVLKSVVKAYATKYSPNRKYTVCSVRNQLKLHWRIFTFFNKFRTGIMYHHCLMFLKAWLSLMQYSPDSYNLLL